MMIPAHLIILTELNSFSSKNMQQSTKQSCEIEHFKHKVAFKLAPYTLTMKSLCSKIKKQLIFSLLSLKLIWRLI